MADHETSLRMDWSSSNLAETFKLFKQRCELYFSVKDIKIAKQVDHILLLSGEEGLKRFNSWGLTAEEKKNPEVIWDRFETQLAPKHNFRIARLYLQNYRQNETESADDFISRLKLQAQKCDFKDMEESNERVIEQFIAGVKHKDLQKDLLSKDKKLTLEQTLDLSRAFEASISHMQQLAEAQGSANHAIQAVNKSYNHQYSQRKCRNCGLNHSFKSRDSCPAFGKTCSNCHKWNHWSNVCQSSKHESNDNTGLRHSKGKPHHRPRSTSRRRTMRHNKQHHVHSIEQDTEKTDSMYNQFDELTFSVITINSVHARDEVYAKLNIKLRNRPGSHTLQLKVDTGAQGNTLPIRIYRSMYPECVNRRGLPKPGMLRQMTHTTLTAYNGSKIHQYGIVTIPCQYEQSKWSDVDFFVVDTDGPAILGLTSSQDFKLITLHCSIQEKTRAPSIQEKTRASVNDETTINSTDDLVKMFPDQFDHIGNFPGEYRIVTDPTITPIIHPPRKCPIQLKDEIKACLDDMLQQGVIKKVDEPTDWVNSLAYSKKADGKLRICLDPKDLNKAIKRNHHRTPTLEEITHQFSGSKYFSKLDAKNGYWSVRLSPESQLLTTFNSPYGRHCFCRLPFGLVMSQDVFQQRMDQILEKCPGTLGIADDVAVHGATEAEHDRNLLNLMKVASEQGLVFNSKKCVIKQHSIPFFGLVYDQHGVHPDPNKVADIQNIPVPENTTSLQEFLGIATYMAPFIPNLSEHTAPLRDLLKKDVEFQWTASHTKVFQKIKELISKETTLAYFDTNKQTVIQVDASGRGLGAVLLQDNKPIAFASKSLTDTERRYANIERELLAVVFACERFHIYVYGKHFITESDHKPLEMISLKNLTAAPPRLQRMLLRLQGYDTTIKYRPGKEMILADSMSRLPSQNNEQIALDVKINFVQFSSDKLKQIQQETSKDPVLSALKDIIIDCWPESQKQLPTQLRPYWSYRDELSVENGLILKGSRIVIPDTMHEDILSKIHAGHQGAEKCKLRAKSCVFWKNMNSDIENLVKMCNTCCQYQRSQSAETLKPHEIPTRAWEVLGTDLFFLDGETYLIIADYYSKFPIVRKINGQCTSKAVVDITKQVFSEHGIPARVISDNGRHFDSHTYHEFSRKWSFDHITSSPHYAQSNGFIERCIQTVKNTLKKAKASALDPDIALLCLRTTPVDHVIPSPAELLYTRKIQGNLPVKLSNPIAHKDIIHQRLEQRQAIQKEYHDRHAHDLPPLITGQDVYVQNQQTGLWKPATVQAKCMEPRSYVVETDDGQTLRRNRRHIQGSKTVKKTVTFKNDDGSSDQEPAIDTVPQKQQQNIQAGIKNNVPDSKTENTLDQELTGYQTKSGRVIKKPERYKP